MKQSRQTRQKEILYSEVKKFSSFFNAEELYEKAKKKDRTLGIATIYRFLKDLRENNNVHFYVCERKLIYSFDKQSHCHFTCKKCGRMSHLKIDSLDFLKKKFGAICHFQIDVEGICMDCL
ncbi:transcriptional repressor [Candidatus Pacearchaeota archaeon]|nr:transcriptional repressor [Candidatus Pacearchaeota archaeon]